MYWGITPESEGIDMIVIVGLIVALVASTVVLAKLSTACGTHDKLPRSG